MSASHRRAGIACVAASAIGLLVAGCGSSVDGSASAPAGAGSSAASAQAGSAPSTSGSVRCGFTATPSTPAPSGHDVGLPPASTTRSGTVSVTLHTSQGDIPISMPRATAPCTVASFAFLAAKNFFNSSPCHRITSYPAPTPLAVLQCGDPTGTGSGGPGYTIPDENPTNLPPVQGGQAAVYAKGTVAMANTGDPHSGGSQFFLVYQDSQLPPSYAVFGRMSAAGLATVAKIAANGIKAGTDPSSGQSTPYDGAPKIPVTSKSVTVSG